MPHARGMIASQPGHLEALRAKHAALQAEIDAEQKRPAMRVEVLRTLKRQKLKLKERITEHEGGRA